MKVATRILSVLLCLLFTLSACNKEVRQSKRIQTTLHEQQHHAEELMQSVCNAIKDEDFDDIWKYSQEDKNILFYVYKGEQMVYWSNSWLTSTKRNNNQTVFDKWYFTQWDNAQGVCFKKQLDDFQVIVAIPIKYHYSYTSKQLQNSFIEPFSGELDVELSEERSENAQPIYSYDGAYLFSIVKMDEAHKQQHMEVNKALDNFSYKSIFDAKDEETAASEKKLKAYYIIISILIILLLLLAIFSLIRYRGFKRMRLGGKFQIILTPTILVMLLSIFMVSMEHSRKVFIETQQLRLTKKTQYIKKALQDMYFWDVDLSQNNTEGLNVDLRDMSFAYEADIHVYDLNGQLIGTSVPELFKHGLMPSHIAPEPFFQGKSSMLQYEHIGDVNYLTAYTEFVNGNDMKLGYIAVPSFISQKEIGEHLEAYTLKILPLYLALLLGAVLVVWGISRMVTSSLGVVSNQLKKNRLGESPKHIDYPYSDEIGELVTHYNQMMDALEESTARLANSEREMAWRTMARQVAHEINNPLTPMKLTLQQLQRTKGTERFDSAFDRSTKLLIDQIDNLSHIAKSFSSFAKMPEVHPTTVDVADKLAGFITIMSNNSSGIPIRYIGPENGVFAIVDADQITQVFTNIVKNALQAMQGRENSDIIIILKSHIKNNLAICPDIHTSNMNWIEISISDNGPGIAHDVREKVFVPNFTTKNTGAGLGLPISKNIVEGSGGKIAFQTSDAGTTFFIYLMKA